MNFKEGEDKSSVVLRQPKYRPPIGDNYPIVFVDGSSFVTK